MENAAAVHVADSEGRVIGGLRSIGGLRMNVT
jgi:hypothetical protein